MVKESKHHYKESKKKPGMSLKEKRAKKHEKKHHKEEHQIDMHIP
jgi:hypothetical protein